MEEKVDIVALGEKLEMICMVIFVIILVIKKIPIVKTLLIIQLTIS